MNSSVHRAVATIDLTAIAENARALRARAGVELMAVLKADAYGHGLIPVAKAAISGGATWLGTALLQEALDLRLAGINDVRIMAWLTPPGDQYREAIENDIDLSAASVESVEEIAGIARRMNRKARLHLEVDTGMTRGGALGAWPDVVAAMAEHVELGELYLAGVWSHFARADEPGHPANMAQRNSFEEALRVVYSAGMQPEVRHLSNSAATLADPDARYDLVRTGIALYGLSPDPNTLGSAARYGLRPAMSLTARLLLVKDVPEGVAVSYGGTAITQRATRVGIVPMGYADGVPRHGSNALSVGFDGKVTPVLGRICMDQFVIDLGPNSQAKAGDEVTLFGPSGPSVDDWAIASTTINYEIVTRLGPRVMREFV
ncbi:MAG TPA: alanine racemase [Candidatus Nanopelagicaceae bacterium]|nr:alanine racemase [Candidatus Nanopelagicaceae bacterium]